MFPVYSPDIGSLFRGSPVYIAGMFRWDVIAPRIASFDFSSSHTHTHTHTHTLSLSITKYYTMTDKSSFTFLPLGAIIQEFRIAGQNIVLSFDTQEHYAKYNTPHFGATIGRVANRIKDGVIHNLNGRDYTFAKNNGPNSIHGGQTGWGQRVFDGPHTVNRNGKDALLFKYLSPDGEEGYPGTIELRVWYTASKEDLDSASPKTVLTVEYEVEFVGTECEETVVNLTNHR